MICNWINDLLNMFDFLKFDDAILNFDTLSYPNYD